MMAEDQDYLMKTIFTNDYLKEIKNKHLRKAISMELFGSGQKWRTTGQMTAIKVPDNPIQRLEDRRLDEEREKYRLQEERRKRIKEIIRRTNRN